MKENLTQAEVAETVSRIGRVCHDDELARHEERRLWESVLVAAANGEDVTELAQTALGTRNFVFESHSL